VTHFSDGVQAGSLAGIYTGPQPNCTMANYLIVPIALSANGIALTQTLAAAGALTLNGARVAAGRTYAALDVPRRVTITSAGDDSGITFTVRGADIYGRAMSQVVTGANAGAATTLKAFSTVVSVTASAATAAAVTVGFSNAFGLPVRCTSAPYVLSVKWDAALAADAGTFVAADVTSPATGLTGDVRGIYTPSSVADGVKVLSMVLAMPAPADQVATFGVKQV
jgi:hypothetical protein